MAMENNSFSGQENTSFHFLMAEYHAHNWKYYCDLIYRFTHIDFDQDFYDFAAIRANYHQNQKNYHEYMMFPDDEGNIHFTPYEDLGELFM